MKKRKATTLVDYILLICALLLILQMGQIFWRTINKDYQKNEYLFCIFNTTIFLVAFKTRLGQWKINKEMLKIPDECFGCENLHGQVYGEKLLVCGFHPYGQENCPDYE